MNKSDLRSIELMANYSIRDLENFTGIKAHTLRIWEKRYNIVKPKRTCTNIRYYDDEDLKKLLNISILNRNGIKISNIVEMSDQAISEKVMSLASTKTDTDTQVESLVVAMIDLDERKFEKIFTTAVLRLGFEETVLRILYPFFERIGILWQIGTISPAQEHFISNLIRQKLIVAIDGLEDLYGDQASSWLLFLPEGEHHELGLLFYYYLLKKNGQKVIYLGETVPFEALKEIPKNRKVDHLLTSMTTPMEETEYSEYLQELSNTFQKQDIFITGLQVTGAKVKLPDNIISFTDVNDFRTNHLKPATIA